MFYCIFSADEGYGFVFDDLALVQHDGSVQCLFDTCIFDTCFTVFSALMRGTGLCLMTSPWSSMTGRYSVCLTRVLLYL